MPCKFCGKYYGLFVWPRCERGHWHRYRDDTLESRTDLGLRAVATRHTMKGTCELLARTNPRQCATSAGRWLHLCYSTHRWHATDRPMSAWGRHSPGAFRIRQLTHEQTLVKARKWRRVAGKSSSLRTNVGSLFPQVVQKAWT